MTTKEAVCNTSQLSVKKIILSIFSLLVLCRTAGAQDARKAILSAADAGTCTANSTACSFLTVPSGAGGVTFTITANASANTIQFEATGDTEPTGSHTWVALSVFPSNATTSVTSTTSTGTWQANVAGFTQVRLRMSTFVGGTTTTYINLSTASARVGGGGSLPTGCTSPGAGAITCTGTVTADIGSFNSVGENFTDMACGAQSVGNANQVRASCDGTNWPVWSMNGITAAKAALSMGVNAQTIGYTATQSDCGKLITMNGVSLTFTLPAAIINSACVFDVKNLAATSLTISRNGLNVDGAAANPTALTQNQSYRITNDGAGYWTEALQIGTSTPALSALTAAGASNTIANGNNPQTWNWAQTTDSQAGFTPCGETSAATGGTLTNGLANQSACKMSTATNSTATPLSVVQGSITNTVATPLVQFQGTWNNAGLTGQGILLDITSTASAAASLLANLRIGGTTQFQVNKAGEVFGNARGLFAGDLYRGANAAGTQADAIIGTNVTLGSGGVYRWANAGNVVSAGVDTGLSRISAGLIGVGTSGAATVDGTMKGAAFLSASTTHALTMPVTIGSGTSIGSTTLCAAADCPAGLYAIPTYIVLTTACGTTGSYTVNLIYTDDQGAKTIPVNINGTGAVPATGVLTTTSTANFGEDVQVIQVASGNINYSTTAVACGTAGPMVGKLYMVADRRM